jgi:hypothetical protein
MLGWRPGCRKRGGGGLAAVEEIIREGTRRGTKVEQTSRLVFRSGRPERQGWFDKTMVGVELSRVAKATLPLAGLV